MPFWNWKPRSLNGIIAIALLVGVFLTMLNIRELRRLQASHLVQDNGQRNEGGEGLDLSGSSCRKPTYWVKANHPDSGYLSHVFAVLDRLGFIRGSKDSNWDVLWHHDYPFLDEDMKPILKNLYPHQKVNHIPGSGFYTSKVNLATSNMTGIPPAFRLPDEKQTLLDYAAKHPDKYWVQKSNKHRGIEVHKLKDMDLAQENSFIQEFILKPFLIDGR